MTTAAQHSPHRVSVVVPVYQGERTLPALLAELEPHTRCSRTPDGTPYVVEEVVLVFDHGPDHSAATSLVPMAKRRRPNVVRAASSQTTTTVGIRKVKMPSGTLGSWPPMTGISTDRVNE